MFGKVVTLVGAAMAVDAVKIKDDALAKAHIRFMEVNHKFEKYDGLFGLADAAALEAATTAMEALMQSVDDNSAFVEKAIWAPASMFNGDRLQ
jgi:hypothetical protein